MAEYETVIGLEVHAQLLTESKMFCGCSAHYAAAPPNTTVCTVCLGLPGALPTMNRAAVEYTIMTGLALNCRPASFSQFDRKNYHYPDLMKGYQISQFAWPLVSDGWMMIETSGGLKRIGVTRVHLEEDTARLLHRTSPSGEHYTLVDVNRSGVPLMEIVSEPDISSPEEARLYLMKLRTILQYLGVSTGSMEEGAFRVDANVSVRLRGSAPFGTKVEVKNMNSFRAVERALEYEVVRQIKEVETGGKIVQETRGWVEDKGITVSQRSKEFAHDYRYFPEPDLPPLVLSEEWVSEVRAKLPELPDARSQRFIDQYGLSAYDAGILTGSKAVADYYEAAVALHPDPKMTSNWVMGELFRLLKGSNLDIQDSKVRPQDLAELLKLVDQGVVSQTAAKEAIEEMFATGKDAGQVVAERGLTQISDRAALEAQVETVLAENPQAVEDYKAGKRQAGGFLVGQVMKLSKGKANPAVVNEVLRSKLGQ
jgi:aspartyl-tRNA(Asn)/glutamyl-tRNA(Gln) amidotransferase subunit B